jgi:hypothetical protein
VSWNWLGLLYVIMPSENTKNILVSALFLVVFALFSAFALRPAQLRMLSMVEDARDSLIAQAETALDKKIAYKSAGFAFPVMIDVRGVSLYGGNPGGIPDVSAVRIRIRYSLREILAALWKREPFDLSRLPIKEVVIDRPETAINITNTTDITALSGGIDAAEHDKPLSTEVRSIEQELQKIFALLPDGLIVRVNKGSVGVAVAEAEGTLGAIKADVRVKKGRVKLDASWQSEITVSAASVKQTNEGQPLLVSVGSRVRADFSVADGSGRGTVRLLKIRSSLADISQLAFTATLADRRLTVEKIGGKLPYALSMSLDLDSGAADVNFNAERFAAYSFLTLKGAFRRYGIWIPATVSGTAHITATLGTADAVTAFDVNPFFDVSLRGAFRPQSPLGSTSFVIQGTGDTRRVRISRAGLTMPHGDLFFSGDVVFDEFAIDGVFRINDFVLQDGYPINGEFIIDTQDRTTTLFAETFFLGSVEFSAFNLDITREEESAAIGLSALRFRETGIDEETGFGDIRLGRVSSEGFLNWKENSLDVNLALEEMSAKDLLDIAHVFAAVPELPDMLDGVISGTEFTTDVFVSTDFKSVTYSIPVFVTAYTGKEKNGKSTSITAASSISGTETHFTIVESTVIMPDGTLNVSADFDFADYNDIYFTTELLYKDLFYYFSGQVLDKSSITLTGSYNLQAFFSLSDTGSFSGYLRTSNARIPYKDQVINASLTSALRYDSAENWSLDLDMLEIQNLQIGTMPIAALRIVGRADQNGTVLPSISIVDSGGTLSGNGRADWDMAIDSIALTVNLADTRGSEMFYADVHYLDGALDLQANATALKLSRFFRNSFNATLSGIVDFKIDNIFAPVPDNWSLGVSITSLAAVVGTTDVTISTHGVVNPTQFTLLDTRVNWGGTVINVPSVDFDGGQLNAAAQVRGIILGRNVSAEMEADVDFQSFTSLLRFQESFSDFDGKLSLASMQIDNWTMENPSDFIFNRHDTAVFLSGGPSNMIRLDIEDGGDFYAGFSAPSPIRGVVTGNVNSGNIAARGSNLYVDLLALWNYVPAQDIINIKGGFAIADIEVRGPLNDPEFFGTAQGASVRLEIPLYLNDLIGPLPIAITLDGQEMRFGPVRAPCGIGYAMVTGEFEFNRWVPSNFTITIEAEETNPIPYKVNISGVKAYGEASGLLEIALQDNVMNITGDLLGENTEITFDPAGINSNTSADSTMQVIVNFTITTGRRVVFLWPNEDLPILQANPASGNSIHIESDSFSGALDMRGNIEIQSGQIFYIERSFYIREGRLIFNENETRFDPQIAARAEIRDRTDDGPVTISLVIDSQPLSTFQPRFESTPALSQTEIFALLGQNIIGGETSDTGQISGAFGGAITDVLSQFSVVRRIERAIRDILHVDMFSVRTQAISNVVLQITSLQSERERNRGFSQYFDNTTIFVGKYITSDFFLQGMFALRYDDYSTEFNQQGLKFEPDIGIELRSPLFDIRWNIVPTHAEKLFIPDTSFTILWRKTF